MFPRLFITSCDLTRFTCASMNAVMDRPHLNQVGHGLGRGPMCKRHMLPVRLMPHLQAELITPLPITSLVKHDNLLPPSIAEAE